MIRRLTNLLVLKNADLSLINKCQHLQENSLKVTLTEFKRQFSSRKTYVEDEFQEDKSFGVKNLEQVGIINKHMSWPQYNRIIYPPTEDGTPMKNPVSINF
jgi:hypothetical protein